HGGNCELHRLLSDHQFWGLAVRRLLSEDAGRPRALLRRRHSLLLEHAGERPIVFGLALRRRRACRTALCRASRRPVARVARVMTSAAGTPRIASFLPAATEMVFALGLGDALV